MKEKFFIAQVGRTVGLRGDLKLHIHTDFPEQFRKGARFESSRGVLEISSYDPKRGLVHFSGYDNLEDAKALTNTKLYSNKEQTVANCNLNENEYFWFDIIGCSIKEDKEILGSVADIQRMLDIDYLLVKTSKNLQDMSLPKEFLIPYIPRYILSVDTQNRVILVKDAKDILEAS